MKKYLLIGFGGILGSLSRIFIKNLTFLSFNGLYLNTLLTNLLGSFFLSLFLTLIISTFKLKENLKLSISVGFLGSFTTFSTFCKEAFFQFNINISISLIYIFLTIILGLLCGLTGIYLGNYINKKLN